MADSKEKKTDVKIPWKRLFVWGFKTIKMSFGLFIATLFLMIFVNLISMYQPIILSKIIEQLSSISASNNTENSVILNENNEDAKDDTIVKENSVFSKIKNSVNNFLFPDSIKIIIWYFLIIVILQIIISFISDIVSLYFNSSVTKKIKLITHDKLLKLGPRFHKEYNLGRTTLIVNNFTQGTQMFLCGLYQQLPVQFITLIISFYILFKELSATSSIPLYLKLGLLLLIIILPIIGFWFSKYLQKSSVELRKSMIDTQNEFLNSATNPLEVQVMNAIKSRSKVFNNSLVNYLKVQIKSGFLRQINQQFQSGITPILQSIFIIFFVGQLFMDLSKAPQIAGAILVFIFLIPKAISPIQSIIMFVTGIRISIPELNEVIDLIESEDIIKDCDNPINLDEKSNTVSIKELVFSYTPDGKRIFDNVTYDFKKRKKTAIVAQIGVGKSTLLNLLVRLYEPLSGNILISDKDIRQYSLASLRSKIVRVSQFPLFVDGTVRDNFKLIKENAQDSEIEEVCNKTGFWNILLKKMKGSNLASPLDMRFTREAGGNWTGGERKILALTRALLLNPSILLLDEPTSGVDAINSKEIANIVNSDIYDEITIILVDHNPEFIEEVADEIICLDNGKIVDSGTPSELLSRNSLYKQLFEIFDENSDTYVNTKKKL